MTDLAMIVAVAKNNVIGKDNKMPWHLPEDLKWFKKNTLGKPMIMGRKTFDSLGQPLPGRTHIVVTRTRDFDQENVFAASNLNEAIELANEVAERDKVDEIMVIGGGTIYAQALPKVTRIYRTLVELEPDGDTFFPLLPTDWKVKREEEGRSGDVNFLFQVVEKSV